jgi:hypothetical protein
LRDILIKTSLQVRCLRIWAAWQHWRCCEYHQKLVSVRAFNPTIFKRHYKLGCSGCSSNSALTFI